MTVQLRDYRLEAVEAVEAAAQRGVRRPLVALPTGTGKTLVFSELIRRRGGRAIVIAHREELIDQARDKLRMVSPELEVGVVKAERDDHDARVVVASIQTLSREHRMDRVLGRSAQMRLAPLDPFATVVVDEAHHAAARTYREAIAQLGGYDPEQGPLVVGVTATPERGDQVGLDAVFEEIVYQLGRALIESEAPEHALAAYEEHAAGRKTLIFTPTVEVARLMAETFAGAGMAARWVSGETPQEERAATLAAFRSGEVEVLANCMVLTEGYDEPSVECLIIARPTKSRPLYVQMIGRGTRRSPGKADCLVIDLLGNSRRHSLMTVSTLAGLPPELVEGRTLTRALAEQGKEEAPEAVDGGRVVGEEFDLFAESDLSWAPGDGFYVPPPCPSHRPAQLSRSARRRPPATPAAQVCTCCRTRPARPARRTWWSPRPPSPTPSAAGAGRAPSVQRRATRSSSSASSCWPTGGKVRSAATRRTTWCRSSWGARRAIRATSGPSQAPRRNPKDQVEDSANRAVCDGHLQLAAAQRSIAGDWVAFGHELRVLA